MGEETSSCQTESEISANTAGSIPSKSVEKNLLWDLPSNEVTDHVIEEPFDKELSEKTSFSLTPSSTTVNDELRVGDGESSFKTSFPLPAFRRGKVLKNIVESLAPETAGNGTMTSKEKQSTSPTPDKNGTDTGIIPCNFFPARRGKSLRFKNKSANISPATRALSTPKFSGRSIAVTPYEREGRKDLEHPTLCPTSGVKTNKPIKCKKTAGSNADQIYFPIAVHELVTETSNQNPEIIDWVENGEAFVIKVTTGKKLERILKKHFRHGNFTSLQRQLNMYGWSKWQIGKYKGAFYNPNFHRDIQNPEDLKSIQRNGPPSSAKRSTTKVLKSRVVIARKSLISHHRFAHANDSSSCDEWENDEETLPDLKKVVTQSGRTRVTPVRFTYETTVKVAPASNVMEVSKSIQMSKTLNTKSIPKMRPALDKELKVKAIPKTDSTVKSVRVPKRRHVSQEVEPKLHSRSTKRIKTENTAPLNSYIPSAPTPTATTPSKFFSDLRKNGNADVTSRYWGYDPVSLASVPEWSPFLVDRIPKKESRLLLPLLHAGGTPGSVRMTLFHGNSSLPSPMMMSPGPHHHQVGGNFTEVPPPALLYRSASSCSTLGSTPIPLPLLRKESSSVYVQEFIGYIPALQAALGVNTLAPSDSAMFDIDDGMAAHLSLSSSSPNHTGSILLPSSPRSYSPVCSLLKFTLPESPRFAGCN